MKRQLSPCTLNEQTGVHVCQNSHVITKKSSPDIKNDVQTTHSDHCSPEFQCQDDSPVKVCDQLRCRNESIDQPNVLHEPNLQFQQQLALAGSTGNDNYEYADTCSSKFETIISSVLDPFEVLNDSDINTKADTCSSKFETIISSVLDPFEVLNDSDINTKADTCSSKFETISSSDLDPFEVLNDSNINSEAGSNNDSAVLKLGTVDNSDTISLCDYQTCSISDYGVSEMTFANLPFHEDTFGMYPFQDYNCAYPNSLLTLTAQGKDMMLPDLEDFVEENSRNINSYQRSPINLDDAGLYLGEVGSNINMSTTTGSDHGESFDPQLFIRDLPELSDVIENFQSAVSSKRTQRKKLVTLVLDLDETLIHSSFEHCDDADITYTIFYCRTEQTVYVKKRPHLITFLEKVAEMFKVVIFTASQRYYAEQILNRLDPEGNLISERAYRDSCILLDGKYTKDLTVLGVDLAKVAIIDNTPEVYRLQVNNGIPIRSWYDDPSDSALVTLLPFLETLADAEDVRPLIAEKFGNKEQVPLAFLLE